MQTADSLNASTVQDLISSIQVNDRRIASLRSSLQDMQEHGKDLLRSLQELIQNGGTTGDRIRDFTIVTHGTLGPEWPLIYAAFEQVLAENVGNVATTYIMQPTDNKTYRHEWNAGIIKEPTLKFDLERRTCSIAVERHGVSQNLNYYANERIICLVDGETVATHVKLPIECLCKYLQWKKRLPAVNQDRVLHMNFEATLPRLMIETPSEFTHPLIGRSVEEETRHALWKLISNDAPIPPPPNRPITPLGR